MTVLCVLLAPDGGAEEILDVLADLSGAALLDPLLWVGADSSGATRAMWVADGRRRPTSLQDVVVGRRPDRVRLGVLVPLVTEPGPLPATVERQVAADLSAGAAGAPLTLVRHLLARGGDRKPALDEVGREGWHNVLVAPERVAGPAGGRWVLPAMPAHEAARLLAPQVAGLAGLWRGAPDGPLDDLAPPPGRSVRVARAFYRRIDADAVEDALREVVLATRPALPLPRGLQGASTTYLGDPGQACEDMARALWERHAPVLAPQRGPRSELPVRPAGVGTALAWYPTYLRRAARDRPDRWFSDLRSAVLDDVPHVRQAQVFAAMSAADLGVLVDGRRPDGDAAGWSDVGEVIDRIEGALPPDPGAPPLPDDLRALWADFAGGALTLLDAGDRGGQAMPPARSGPTRGVLRAVEAAVPGPEHDLVPHHGNVAAITDVTSVAVGDVLGADVLRRRLSELAVTNPLGGAVVASLDQLGAWQHHHQGAYVHRVGLRLAERMEAVRAELRDGFAALAEATGSADVGPTQRRRMLLTSRVTAGTGALALATALVTVVGMLTVLGATATAAILLVAALGGGLVLTGGEYLLGHRRLFRGLNHRRIAVARVEADQQNLRLAMRDYRRLRDAYQDFLLWSRAVAAVAAEPFGRAGDAAHAGRPVLRDLPPSARTGRAAVDPAALPPAATALRADLFVTGWLGAAWSANLDRLAPATGEGPGYGPHGERPGYGPHGGDARARLAAWVDELLRRGPTTGTGDRAWASVMAGLAGPQGAVAEALLSTIHDDEDADTDAPRTRAAFLAGIDDPSAAGGHFDGAHFTATAQTEQRADIVAARSSGSRRGLSRTDVLVQYGDAVADHELELGIETFPDEPPDPPVPPLGDIEF